MRNKSMNIVIVAGSGRQTSQSIRLAQWIANKFETSETSYNVLDLYEYRELINYYEHDKPTELNKTKTRMLDIIDKADGVIIVSPEWGGMLPPLLHQFLLLNAYGSADNRLPLANKPCSIVGISSSGGGHNPISLIKGYGAKNTHLSWLSEHVVINNVDIFIDSPTNHVHYEELLSRLHIMCEVQSIYAQQLKPVRSKLNVLSSKHPFGQ